MTVLDGTTANRRTRSVSAVYDLALAEGGRRPLLLRSQSWSAPLPVTRWCGDADHVDMAVLDRFMALLPTRASVLDIGCGPGRHAAHIRDAGHRVLGVDTSHIGVELTRSRGAEALCANVLGPLPNGSHGWDGVVLLDGNIGIGGDSLLLLCRVRDLLSPGGRVVVELDASGATYRGSVVLDDGDWVSTPFPWARLSPRDLQRAACLADLRVLDAWGGAGGCFAILTPGATRAAEWTA